MSISKVDNLVETDLNNVENLNAYFHANIGADTAENEQQFAKCFRSTVVSPRRADPGHG